MYTEKSSKNIKVLNIITRSSPIGGAQMVLLDNVIRNSFTNIVITGNEGVLTERLRLNGIKVIVIKNLKRNFSIYDVSVFFKIIFIIKKEKINFVTSHSSKIGVLARLACFFTNTRNAFVVHGWSFSNDNSKIAYFFFLFVEKFMKFFTDYFILVSKYDIAIGLKKNILKNKNHILIYNGSKDLSQNNLKRKKSKKIVISFVARFSTQKDHETLFDALSLLNDEQKDLLIINLIGGGELIDKFIDKSISMKISRSLNFVGETSDVNKYLFNSDLFMLISNYEGLPVSIIEALSVGLPIIASDVGGVNELVTEGVNGFLIPKKDSIALYKVLVNLVSDNNYDIESMGRKSREIYEESFKLDIMTTKTESLINTILQKNKN